MASFGQARLLAFFAGICILSTSPATAESNAVNVAGLSFPPSTDFSVSIVQYDDKGYHYSGDKPRSLHMNIFYVSKAISFDGDIFDSSELLRSENTLKSGKTGKPFSIFGATRISTFRNVVVLDSLKVNEFESQNISFERSMFLSDDKYYYVVSFHENELEFKRALVSQNQELFLFKGKSAPSWISEKLAHLYRSFSSRKEMPSHIEELNRLIDKTMDTMDLVRR